MKTYLKLGTVVLGVGLVSIAGAAFANEPDYCLSENPADWPEPSKPYFLLAVDTSGSMGDNTDSGSWWNSCGYHSNDNGTNPYRNDAARCALYNTVLAYSGLVHFGLMTFPTRAVETGGGPNADCNTFDDSPGNNSNDGCGRDDLYSHSCGANYTRGCCDPGDPAPSRTQPPPWGGDADCNGDSSSGLDISAQGGRVLVPLQQHDYWNLPQDQTASNTQDILDWVDNDCGGCQELWASGYTPLHGLLRDAHRYLESSWTDPTDSTVYSTPLTGSERPCRSVNVILVTDGTEYCEPDFEDNNDNAECASNAAWDLNQGATVGGTMFPVRTHVIALGDVAGVDNIAYGGGTDTAYIANNEVELAAALASIISSAMPPEECDNSDTNCNGCSDEGFKKYCSRNVTPKVLGSGDEPDEIGECCDWTNETERDACIDAFELSIDSATNPQGSGWLLPCWDPDPSDPDPETKWLCADPGETCDDPGDAFDGDNNCDVDPVWWRDQPLASSADENQDDEGHNKCPNCPTDEVCDGADNDCNGFADDGISCPSCSPTDEICDGRDNNCDGRVDESLATIQCGLPPGPTTPTWCSDTQSCNELPCAGGTPEPGCFADPPTNSYDACDINPQEEGTVCNRMDDNCNGIVDDGVPPVPCAPDPNLVYRDYPNPGDNPTSGCEPGSDPCDDVSDCIGGTEPDTEVCNGIDDDCDGEVDEDLGFPVGEACSAPCGEGTTQCVDGALRCVPEIATFPETCNGIDDDCNGVVDDNLSDAPATPGCWTLEVGDAQCEAGVTCTHLDVEWCPPEGAECDGLGELSDPCNIGALRCEGANGWVCRNDGLPDPETCDGNDNDCDGSVDELDDMIDPGGMLGTPCGNDTPPCSPGVWVCSDGVLECTGDPAGPEVCDGVDNDCDEDIDETGAPPGGVDGTADPDDESRVIGETCGMTGGECQPGIYECVDGDVECVGGQGPEAELCDGRDNDCDGQVDEAGDPPGGIDGTADPQDPDRVIGEPCGSDEGDCQPGEYACVNGLVVCVGGVGPQPERCDCSDNDCDGEIDEDPEADEPELCPTGKTCVSPGAGRCVCAAPCAGGEFPCPSPTVCELAVRSGTDGPESDYCIPPDACGDCSVQTAVDSDGDPVCGPEGTLNASGQILPECVCNENECGSPCEDRICPENQLCVPTGLAAGTCQDQSNCNYFGCPPLAGEDRVCHDGSCVTDPCADGGPCESTQVCRPTASFAEARCEDSCADMTCEDTEVCVGGACADNPCGEACPDGQYCVDDGSGTYGCADSQCEEPLCSDGSYCDPLTGDCGDDPCAGVHCPGEQVCVDGECAIVQQGTGGTEGTGGGAGATATGSGGSVSGGGVAGSGTGAGTSRPETDPDQGVWGLPTGGGGCSCRTAPAPYSRAMAWLGLGLLAISVVRRRRRIAVRVGRERGAQ